MKQARFTTVLFDLDHTLLDSDASEAMAFEQALRAAGVDEPHRHLPAYDRINTALWHAVERQEITPGQVRTTRFEQLIAEAGLDADPAQLSDGFALGLGQHGELYPGALEMLEAVAEHASLGLVTNGLSDIQRARIERLGIARYFQAVVISAEVGCSKPFTAIFDIAFERLRNPSKASSLMVGDSLSSDIQGGTNYGINTCWYNWRNTTPGELDRFDFEIADLDLLLPIVATT